MRGALAALLLCTAAGAQNWPEARHDPMNTGLSPGVGAIDSQAALRVRWQRQTPYAIEQYMGPTVGDVNADGVTDVLTSSGNANALGGLLYALRGATGDTIWTHDVGAYQAVDFAPLISDIDDDGIPEVVGAGGFGNFVFAVEGESGVRKWTFYTTNFVDPSSAKVGNFDADPFMELLIGSVDFYLYCINSESGLLNWAFLANGAIQSTPALADVDGDGKLEAIIGDNLYTMWAVNTDNGTALWSAPLDGDAWCSPALANMDADTTLEVVTASRAGTIYILNAESGTLVRQIYTGSTIWRTSPAVGDVDADGENEIIIANDAGYVLAYNADGTSLWSFYAGDTTRSSPALADIDGDGRLEVLIGSRTRKVYCLNAEDGSLLWEFTTANEVKSAVSVGDVDADGELEVICTSLDGVIYVLDNEGALPTRERDAPPYLSLRVFALGDRVGYEFTLPAAGRSSVTLYDASGALVERVTHSTRAARGAFSRALSSGTYLVLLESPSGSKTVKVAVVR